MLPKIITVGYKALNLCYYFTAGKVSQRLPLLMLPG